MVGMSAPTPAFVFRVAFSDLDVPIHAQEVSGLSSNMDTTTFKEAGAAPFVRQLPHALQQPGLTIKRALAPADHVVLQWVKDTLEHDLAARITVRDCDISLLDEGGSTRATWHAKDTYPIKWRVGALDAMNNSLALEELELAVRSIERRA